MFKILNRHRVISPALFVLMLSVCVSALPVYASFEEEEKEALLCSIETVSDGYTSRQSFTYDDDGNLLQMTTEMDMDGTTDTTTVTNTYADGLRQTSETEMVTDLGFNSFTQNTRTEFSYQEGVLVGAETTDTEDGEVLSVSQTAYTYDDNGLLTEETTTGDDGSVESVTYTYDDAGQLTKITRSYAAADYAYDTEEEYENGLMIHQTVTGDDFSSETQNDYDEHGNIVSMTVMQDGTESVSTYDNTYDEVGRLVKVICTTSGDDPEYDMVQTSTYEYAER